MIWPAIPLLAIVFGLANHARGRGTLIGGRWACAAYGGVSIGLVAVLLGFDVWRSLAISAATTLGFYNWLVWGWGLYFAAFTGKWPYGLKEIPWIDSVCFWLIPWRTGFAHWTNYVRGWIGMTLRGLYLIPMFILFDPLGGITPIWFFGIIGVLQGFIYSAARIGGVWRDTGTALPELLIGLLIGATAGGALIFLTTMG